MAAAAINSGDGVPAPTRGVFALPSEGGAGGATNAFDGVCGVGGEAVAIVSGDGAEATPRNSFTAPTMSRSLATCSANRYGNSKIGPSTEIS